MVFSGTMKPNTEDWEFREKFWITKLKIIIERQQPLTPDQRRSLYTIIYNMYAQNSHGRMYLWHLQHKHSRSKCQLCQEKSELLYLKYHQALLEYINSEVLSSLKGKQNEVLLEELLRKWSDHKVLMERLLDILYILDQYFVTRWSISTLNQDGLYCFLNLIRLYKVKANAKDAVITLINREREEEHIDRELMKNVMDMFFEMGMREMDLYQQDFETNIIQGIVAYYSRKASSWITHYSFPEYMLKVEKCLRRKNGIVSQYMLKRRDKLMAAFELTHYSFPEYMFEAEAHLRREEDRVSQYLCTSSKQKLLEKVQHELLVVPVKQLLKKGDSRCCALLSDNEEDLSRMYRLYYKVPEGLHYLSIIFKQHVIFEGTALVLEAEDATRNLVKNTVNGADVQEQDLFWKIIKLHDKYTGCVKKCFLKCDLLLEALKEAFDVFCNKTVAGISSAELLATFCDNILKEGGSEKLSDKAIKETLKKAVKLLAYISDKDLFEKFYQDKLARRLLLEGSANESHEKFIFTELKQQCSAEFTSKIESMWHELTKLWQHCSTQFTSKSEGKVYQVKANARDAVITLIDRERRGDQIDRALLKDVINMFLKMGMGVTKLYRQYEAKVLEDTSAYYSCKVSSWITQYSCPDYMSKVEECLKKERDTDSCYLHGSSKGKLVEKVQHELLVVHATQWLEKEDFGFRALLRDNEVKGLSIMYKLYFKIPEGLVPLSIIFEQHVTARGKILVQQANDAISSETANWAVVLEQVDPLFHKIIKLYDKYTACVKNCFLNYSLFRKALKEAFKRFCNETLAGNSIAKLLTIFCNNILTEGGTENDEATKETLKKVVKLLAYINDRHIFEEFYWKKLSRRVLLDRSTNENYEKFMLTKLKQQCSAQFTLKIESMEKDLTLARDNFEAYRANMDANFGIDITVRVLNPRIWPRYKSFELSLPPEMVNCVEKFEELFEMKTKDKKLKWIYSLGSCEMNGKFDANMIELMVSTSQAAVLLLFNNADTLSYSEIKNQLRLSDDDFLIRLLHSLSCDKYKILNMYPYTKAILPTNNFEFNSKFRNEKERIMIPLPPVDEVKMDRQCAIDAKVVRIMKIRKVLSHQQLVKECVEQLSHMFKVKNKEVKIRIEDLIGRGFMERNRENPNEYRYVPDDH